MRQAANGYQHALALLGLLLFVLAISAVWRQSRRPEPVALTPTLTGQTELCLSCHEGIEEISASHPTEAFGCVLCHGGDRLALDADLAHETMRGGRNPSDLSVVEASCGGGACHSGSDDEGRDHIHRVLTSVQGTYAGAIAQVRFTFGEQQTLTAHYGIYDVVDERVLSEQGVEGLVAFTPDGAAPSPVRAFAQRCPTCHLSAAPVAQDFYYRGTGCAAGHVVYDDDGRYQGNDSTVDKNEAGHARTHRMTTAIPYTQCNRCHNQGNYSLAQMAFLERQDRPAPSHLNLREQRLHNYYQPIAQFTLCEWELDCVDCHTSGEVMGDGDIYSSQKDAQYNQCQTCHGTAKTLPQLVTIEDAEHAAIRSARLNVHYTVDVGDTVVGTTRGETFGWVQWDGSGLTLTAKVSGATYDVPLVMGSACEQNVEEQESRYCHECHTYQR